MLRLGDGHTTLKLQVARSVTVWDRLQGFAPVAVTVLTMLLLPHSDGLTVKFALQGAVAPIASEPRLRTVEPVRSSVRTTFVRGTVPQLLTIPLKPIDPGLLLHRKTRFVLQILVTAMQGVVHTWQVAVFVAENVGLPKTPEATPETIMVSGNG